MDKYQEFIEAMDQLTDKRIRRQCLSLIACARIYVGTYEEYSRLRHEVWNVIEQYFEYDEKTKSAKQRQTQPWSVYDRLIMYLYYMQKKEGIEDSYCPLSKNDEIAEVVVEELKKQGLVPYKYYTFDAFLNGVFASKKMFEKDMECEYSLPEIDLKTASTEDIEMNKLDDEKVKMIRQCFKHWQEYKKTNKGTNFQENQLINFSKLINAIETYLKTDINVLKLENYSYKDCFNETFSEEYIKELIQIMKENPALMPMYITPTRNELIGERELVKGKFGGYEKLRTWTIPKYKERYNEPLLKYKEVMAELVHIYKTFNRIS